MKTDLAKWFILNGTMERGGRTDRSIAVTCFTGLRKPSYEWPGRDGVKAYLLDWCDDVLRRDAAFHTTDLLSSGTYLLLRAPMAGKYMPTHDFRGKSWSGRKLRLFPYFAALETRTTERRMSSFWVERLT